MKLEKIKTTQVEMGYFIDTYFPNTMEIGYSVVRSHLNGTHPLMLNKSSNRTYYIIAGSASFEMNNTVTKVNAGEMFVVPKNTKYKFSGKFDALLVDCPKFNPDDDVIFR